MKPATLVIIWILLPVSILAQDAPKQRTVEEIHKLHQDAKAYIAALENPQRDAEQSDFTHPIGSRHSKLWR